MFKKAFFAIVFSVISISLYSQNILSQKVKDTIENNSISEGISILKDVSSSNESSSQEKLESTILVAQILEQQGEYLEACQYYTSAASLVGTNTLEGQQFLLDAVQCTLSVGDVSRADFLLSTALANAQDNSIRSRANIYAVWSWVLKTDSKDELSGPISVLETYVSLDAMKEFRPIMLLTLDHLTEDEKWAKQLISEFPNSPEAAIVTGKAHKSPLPFWYFN